MTPEQQSLMIRVLQFGYATGGDNRFDMIRAYCNAYPTEMFAVIAAATEFEKGCCYCPEQAEQKKQMTPTEFAQWLFPERVAAPATR